MYLVLVHGEKKWKLFTCFRWPQSVSRVMINTFFCLQFRIILSSCLSNLWIGCCLHVSSFRLFMTGCDGGNGDLLGDLTPLLPDIIVLSWHLWTMQYPLPYYADYVGVCIGEVEVIILLLASHFKNLWHIFIILENVIIHWYCNLPYFQQLTEAWTKSIIYLLSCTYTPPWGLSGWLPRCHQPVRVLRVLGH